MVVIAILLLGSLGILCRYLTTLWVPVGFIPWAILTVNALGSFAAGFVGVRGDEIFGAKAHIWVPAVMAGFLGGFTTFSAFAFDTVRLWSSGAILPSLLNLFLNNGVAILLCYLGFRLGRMN